jgi:hypothetical protein
MNQKVFLLLEYLKLNKFAFSRTSLLVLIEELREDIGAPGVGLTPLLVLDVK